MNPIDGEFRPRMVISLAAAVVLFVGLMGGVCVALATLGSHPVDRSDPGSAVMSFVEAMARNDAKTARSLVVSDQWGRIDSWMSKRRIFRCSLFDDIFGDSMIEAGRGPRLGQSYHYHGNWRCGAHYLSVDDITIGWTEEGYTILDWTVVCEGRELYGTPHCE